VTLLEEKRAEVERVSAVVGRRIVEVRYFEIANDSGTPRWDAPDFHSLDFGLEWDLDDGSTWSFIWQGSGRYESVLT